MSRRGSDAVHHHAPRAVDRSRVRWRGGMPSWPGPGPPWPISSAERPGVAVVESHAESGAGVDGLADEGGDVERAAHPAHDRGAALGDVREGRAGPVEGGFEEQRADALLGDRIDEDLAAVGDQAGQLCLVVAAPTR